MRDLLLLAFLVPALIATLRYPFVGVLTWAWFSLMTPHQMAYGVFGLQLNLMIAAVTLVSIGLSGAFRHFRLDWLTGLVLLFAACLCISQIYSLKPEHSAKYFDLFLKTLIFVAVCMQLTTDRLKFHALMWMLAIGIGYFALKGGLFTLATLGQYRVQGLPNTILEDNNHLGTAIATILPLILYLRQQATGALVRQGLLALFVLAIVAVIGTHSRGAFVALLVFGGFFWLRSNRKLLILAGLSVVFVPAIAFMPSKWGERMTTIGEATADASFMGRVDAWHINTELALAHPFTGAGLRVPYEKDVAATVDRERAASAKAAHSIYFEVLGGTGFIGLAVFLGILGTAFMTTMRLQKLKADPTVDPWIPSFAYYAQISLAVFCVGGAAVSMEMWDGLYVLIALIAGASRLAKIPVAAMAPAGVQPRLPSWRVAARGVGWSRPWAKPSNPTLQDRG
ncbi:MAG: putative O-glycosylation ligase, exosortase A system-associated [Parvularculaceae bacterium]